MILELALAFALGAVIDHYFWAKISAWLAAKEAAIKARL